MFNEAFWFFYFVGLIDSLFVLFVGTTMISVVGLIIGAAVLEDTYGTEKENGIKKYTTFSKIVITIISILGLLTFFAPSKEAMYAGAGQYVIEITETDDTLIQLKSIIDDKITELQIEEKE